MANKGYPRTRFSIEDRTSAIEVATNSVGGNMPLAMQAFTSDRGPEEWTIITSLKDFIKKYGEISYVRHGQPQLTVAEILKAGGAVLGKRIVGNNATLANITICARIVKLTESNKVQTVSGKKYTGNTNTNYVYFYARYGYAIDDNHMAYAQTFEEATIDYVNRENTVFSNSSTDNVYGENVLDFPLFTIAAIGRGVSNLSFDITVNHNTNASTPKYILYTLNVYRDNEVVEQVNFSFNPNITIDGVSYAMNPRVNLACSEIKVKNYENSTEAFASALAISTKTSTNDTDAKSMTKNDIINSDFINGTNRTGSVALGNLITKSTEETFTSITTDQNPQTNENDTLDMWTTLLPYDLSTLGTGGAKTPNSNVIIPNGNGISFSFSTASPFAAGTNDTALGDAPIKNAISIGSNDTYQPTEYEKLLLNVFGKKYNATSGKIETLTSNIEINNDDIVATYYQFDPVIYDVDKYKVDFTCDNGYPKFIKRAITDLVEFRGDMVYIADLGSDKISNANSIVARSNEIFNESEEYDYRSKFVAIYHNVFDVYDPYSGKQITVTMPYLLASKLVNHIANGAGRPFAGMLHDITFPEIIKNSINYIPRVTPFADNKQILIDANINYLSMYNDLFVMDTMYVNQPDYTQLSYLNNIMGVQQIIKNIRNRCPASRYTFMDGNDLERYIDDANAIINQYNSYFKSISISYMADEAYESNNIFYAVLKVQFRNFIQEEYFKIIAIS